MLSETLKYRALAERYLESDWQWGLALVEHESAGNPWATGDNGLAVGILQQHPDFQFTYYPQTADNLWAETDQRWHPAFQLACLGQFWKKHAALTFDQRLAMYHLGHVALDPEYVTAVKQAYGLIAAVTK